MTWRVWKRPRRRRVAMSAQPKRTAVQHEKVEQAHIVQTTIAIGGQVFVLGTRRSRGKNCPSCGTFVAEHQGTNQTPGVADLILFLPIRDGRRRLLMWEVKAGDNTMSDAQRKFEALCHEAVVSHGCGDFNAYCAWLIREGYIKAESLPHYRQPIETAR